MVVKEVMRAVPGIGESGVGAGPEARAEMSESPDR